MSGSARSSAQDARRIHSASSNGRSTPSRAVSSMSSSSASVPGSPTTTHVETSVTKLLVTTKQLLESLTLWSEGRATPEQVSDHFVATGNYFNVAVTAFSKENISMDELMSVPDDLRFCLEEALSQDPSPRTLERYLPRVREIVISLLSGLKAKQSTFRSRREVPSPRGDAPLPPPPTAGPSQPRARSPQLERASEPRNAGLPATPRSVAPRRDLPEPASNRIQSPPPRPPSRENSFSGKSRAVDNVPTVTAANGRFSGAPPMPSLPQSSSSSSIQSRAVTPPPRPARASAASPSSTVPPTLEISEDLALPYIQAEAFNPFPTDSPDRSLEKLSAGKLLERRASKRYSAYTYSKITSSSSSNALSGAAGPSEPSAGREFVQNARKPKGDSRDLGKSPTRRPQHDGATTPSRHPTPMRPSALATMIEDDDEEEPSGMPSPSPAPPSIRPSLSLEPVTPASMSGAATPLAPIYPMTVFLQLGRDMKKAGLEDLPSLATLRILFTERFQYNPGLSDFPSIYIRDPRDQSGVQYELEDMADVREGCILSLNIEPLDAVKEQIATGLAALQQELKASLSTSVATLHQELKDLHLTAQKSLSSAVSPVPGSFTGSAPQSPAMSRPSDKQFQEAAQKMFKSESKAAARAEPASVTSPTVSQSSGADARVSRIVSDLKTHYDEVQAVRREIGTLRQVVRDFGTDTKAIMGNMRTQTEKVRHLASSKIGAERAAIRAGKEQFEKRMDDLIPRLEELQDTVDDLRHDVTSKGVRPRQQQMTDIKTRLDALSGEIEGATTQLTTLGPAWKHGWEQELEVIIREQEFLRQQEPLLRDAAADLATLSQVYQTIVQYSTAVGGAADGDSASRRRPKVALAADEPGDHATVMASVRALAPDPQRRLRAIEQAERAREAENANRSDAFKDELGGFVDGKRLRKTGGTEEVDRVREVKSTQTLRAMMSSTLPTSASAETI